MHTAYAVYCSLNTLNCELPTHTTHCTLETAHIALPLAFSSGNDHGAFFIGCFVWELIRMVLPLCLGCLEWCCEAARPVLDVFLVLGCPRLEVHQRIYVVDPGPPRLTPYGFWLVMGCLDVRMMDGVCSLDGLLAFVCEVQCADPVLPGSGILSPGLLV